MSKVPWVKFFSDDWRSGVAILSDFEEQVYFKICVHIWNTGRGVPKSLVPRLFRAPCDGIADALRALVGFGKLEETDGVLTNHRALESHQEALDRHTSAKEAAANRWKNKRKPRNAPAMRPHKEGICEPEPDIEPESKKEEGNARARDPSFPEVAPLDISPHFQRPPPPTKTAPPNGHDLEAAMSAYNVVAGRCGLARAQRLTEPRRKKLVLRLAECGGLAGWGEALKVLEANAFLKGDNDRGWRADFDFLLQQSSFTKIMEGSYGRATRSSPLWS